MPVKVLVMVPLPVLGKSADFWRRVATATATTTGHMDDDQVIAREPDRSSWFVHLPNHKIAKLRD